LVPEISAHRINFDSLDIFPVFIDYDMDNMRCRGMSAKLDLFSYGELTREIENLSGEELEFCKEEGIAIRKSKLMFHNGFFLFDFNYIMNDPAGFAQKLKDLSFDNVYIENSRYFQMAELMAYLSFCNAELLEFDDASHG
jgi:hypothetical protein